MTVGGKAKIVKLMVTGAMLAMAAITSGCATGKRAAAPLAFATPQTSYSSGDAFVRALDGGLVSQIQGADLGAEDRKLALQAEYKALEDAPGGQAVPWSGATGVSGTVVAATPYQVGTQNCRQYTQTVSVDGRSLVARGAACRNPNGTWTPLT
ncbi:surface antigen [Rhizobium aquaticum]|uniref:Surface antigen n=1 Tax=Rhizobium aquaticum TaxID=1549636 RepID=A0ABV2IXM9_9HYPH